MAKIFSRQTRELLTQLGYDLDDVERGVRLASEGKDMQVVAVLQTAADDKEIVLLMELSIAPLLDDNDLFEAGRIVGTESETPPKPGAVQLYAEGPDVVWFVPHDDADPDAVARDVERARSYVAGEWRPWELYVGVSGALRLKGMPVIIEHIDLEGDILTATDESEEQWWDAWDALLQQVAGKTLKVLRSGRYHEVVRQTIDRLQHIAMVLQQRYEEEDGKE